MVLNWYSTQASVQNGSNTLLVSYYFSVDVPTQTIMNWYNYNNIGVDVLAPTTLPPPIGNPPSNSGPVVNFFNTSTSLFGEAGGVNYTDTSLQTFLGTNEPFFVSILLEKTYQMENTN